jgi:hypothetical protein
MNTLKTLTAAAALMLIAGAAQAQDAKQQEDWLSLQAAGRRELAAQAAVKPTAAQAQAECSDHPPIGSFCSASASQREEPPIVPIVGDGPLLFKMLVWAEKGNNQLRCAAGMPTCMNDTQWNVAVDILDRRTEHALKALSPKQKNCLFKVVTNPALGIVYDCGAIDDDVDWYYSLLLEVVGPN